jgi:hypothetical protein
MKVSRQVKLLGPSLGKKMLFPKDYNTLIQAINEFIKKEPNKKFQLIEEKNKKEIKNQDDFENMSNEFINEKVVKIRVNIVDMNEEYKAEKEKKNTISNNIISSQAIINLNGEIPKSKILEEEKKELEDKIDNSVKTILKQKMKELEDKLVEELYSNLQTEISKSKIKDNFCIIKEEDNNINSSKMIHRGICCNRCGKENIQGIRYKCVQCMNFNLCENCENNYIHDMRHIMVKIRFPTNDDSELNSKINRNISYKNQDMNYSLEPKKFNLDSNSDMKVQKVTLENIGLAPWKGVYIKCIDDISEIICDENEIEKTVNSGSSIDIQLTFNDIKNQLKPNKSVYYCFLQMFNQKNESFGNVTKIKINMKN